MASSAATSSATSGRGSAPPSSRPGCFAANGRLPSTRTRTSSSLDARQLRRWGLDAGRLPPGSTLLFDEPSLWQANRGYVVSAVVLLALQTWLIIVLLANRNQRLRAQQALAGQLRFETADVRRARQSRDPADHRRARRSCAGPDRHRPGRRSHRAGRAGPERPTHRGHPRVDPRRYPGLPSSLGWRKFPWVSARVGAGHVAVVSSERPLPPEADEDRRQMAAHGTRSLLAIPLVVEVR